MTAAWTNTVSIEGVPDKPATIGELFWLPTGIATPSAEGVRLPLA
jgi:hypothetical protein